VSQESRNIFEVKVISSDTFFIPSPAIPTAHPAYYERFLTGKVTCSVPFNTWDGRALVAIGCAEGVWFGFRHDPQSLQPVLHMKTVKDCAVLEDFGVFLVLADKSLFAYHLEALVPSSSQKIRPRQTPLKLKDNVQFFRVGSILGLTMVILMKKKSFGSVFHVLEPNKKKINATTTAPGGPGNLFRFHEPKAEWFRSYGEFCMPYDAFDAIFLETKIAISCTKGFQLVDLLHLKSAIVPKPWEDARFSSLAQRCQSCRPMGIFRTSGDDFLLCYTGMYLIDFRSHSGGTY
ncbi:CNH domain-containing protein, partial [Mycena sanguinolenta]